MRLFAVKKPIAYFSNEFAVDNDLPTYAGGLGILAADILNESAKMHYPFVGVGILYKGKNYIQHITSSGLTETRDSQFDHDTSFLRPTTQNGKTLIIDLFPNDQRVKVKSYHLRMSDTTVLFLLSTDIDTNPSEWINDMSTLYGGDPESQIRQQVLLGVGGIKLLNTLKLRPKKYHINEGRPEFVIWELTKNFMKSKNLGFTEAWEKAKKEIIYTNHTLVSGGNLSYSKDIVEKFAAPYAKNMQVETSKLVTEGLTNTNTFSTTLFALNTSHKRTAVSAAHAKFAQNEWKGFDFIKITNGVHIPRWQDSEFRDETATDEDIWNHHLLKKRELMESVLKRTGFGYDPKRIVVTWARRLAEYKQPKLIFSDLQRLKNIISKPETPVQILFAGNSHSDDINAKRIIDDIIRIFSRELAGYAIFVPNYNISLANHLTSGSDVWLNTPKGNMEACGTSGMKAISNGVLSCTALDGWTYEADWKDTGWVLDANNTAEDFYLTLEEKIIPMYYKQENNLPGDWIKMMRKSISLSKEFSTERMLKEYQKLLYS